MHGPGRLIIDILLKKRNSTVFTAASCSILVNLIFLGHQAHFCFLLNLSDIDQFGYLEGSTCGNRLS